MLVAILGGTGTAEIFRRNNTGSAYTYSHSVGGVGSEGCMMNGHIYTLRYREDLDSVILKYTLDGDFVASFGAPYISDNPFAVRSLSAKGFLACSEKYGVIGWIREAVPVFTGFDEQGTELWKILFPEFTPSPVEEIVSDAGRPGLRYVVPEEGQSVFSRILVDKNGGFNVSYIVISDEGPTPWHLFRVAPESGRGQYIGEIYHTLYAFDEEHIVYRMYGSVPRVGIAKR